MNAGEHTLIKSAELRDRRRQKPLVTDGRLLVSEKESRKEERGVREQRAG